jgi:flagellar biosynthesis regulator FlbT
VLEIIGKIGEKMLDGQDYQALAQARKLVEYEKAILERRPDDVAPADVSQGVQNAPSADANHLETGS